jgi:fibronectin type 3 domain-containing protein
MKCRLMIVVVASLLMLQGISLEAQMVTNPSGLQWNHNTEADLAGYRVYQSGVSGVYGTTYKSIPAGVNTAVLTDCPTTGQLYWVVTAVDKAGNESGPSNQATALFDDGPPAAPTGCVPIP